MKRETQIKYQERLNRCTKYINKAIQAINPEDPLFERTMKLFKQGQELNKILYGDGFIGSTNVVATQLQSFEMRVERYQKGLPEDVRDDVQERLPVAEQPDAPIELNVPIPEGVIGKDGALKLMQDAMMSLSHAYKLLCDMHPGIRYIPQVDKVNEIMKSIEPCRRELSRMTL